MLVTINNSELVDKLVQIADGNLDLVQAAIRDSAGADGAADLEKVVDYIMARRHDRVRTPAAA